MRLDATDPRDLSAQGLRVAVITAMFNASITKGLTEGAVDYLEEADASEIMVNLTCSSYLLRIPAYMLSIWVKTLAVLSDNSSLGGSG